MFVGKKIEVQLFGGTIVPHRFPPEPSLSLHPQTAPWRSADKEACFSQAFFGRENNFV